MNTNNLLPNEDSITISYILLHEIETRIRGDIKKVLLKNYGFDWQYLFGENKPIEVASIYELLDYFSKYPPLTFCFTPSELNSFSELINIRNKIADMRYLDSDELA